MSYATTHLVNSNTAKQLLKKFELDVKMGQLG